MNPYATHPKFDNEISYWSIYPLLTKSSSQTGYISTSTTHTSSRDRCRGKSQSTPWTSLFPCCNGEMQLLIIERMRVTLTHQPSGSEDNMILFANRIFWHNFKRLPRPCTDHAQFFFNRSNNYVLDCYDMVSSYFVFPGNRSSHDFNQSSAMYLSHDRSGHLKVISRRRQGEDS